MEKEKDFIIAKELFACWDQERRGFLDIDVLAENLISFGLSLSKDQVIKLIRAIKGKADDDEITLKGFLKIFEKDSFGDKATNLIKRECLMKWACSRKVVRY